MLDSLWGWIGRRISNAVGKDAEGRWISLTGGGNVISNLGSMSKQLSAYQNHVYKCVTVIKNRVSSLDNKLVYRRGREQADIERHPFLDLQNKPNPVWSFRQLIEFWQIHLDLCGRAFGLMNLNGVGRPVEIWPLMPTSFEKLIFVEGSMEIAGYKFFKWDKGTQTATTVTYPKEMILDFRYPHPLDMFAGCSPIQQMAFSYDIDLALKMYQRNFFTNNARPDLVFETDQKINLDAARKFLAEWESRYKGLENQWKPAMLGDGLKAHILQQTANDLQLISLMGLTKEDILEAYAVPEGKLGTVKNINKANQHAIDVSFNEECITPRLSNLEEVISTQCLHKYDPNLWIQWENPVPSDMEFELKERELNLKAGYTIINEERAKNGLVPVSWGDEPWFPIGMQQPGNPITLSPMRSFIPEIAKSLKISKDAIRQRHYAMVKKWGQVFQKTYRRWIGEIKKEVTGNIEEVWPEISGVTIEMGFNEREKHAKDVQWDVLNFDLDKATETLILSMTPIIQEALIDAGGDALRLVESGISFDIANPRMLGFLEIRKNLLSKIPQEVYDAIREQVKEGLILGESVASIADRLTDKIWTHESQARALTVARTESASCINRGTLEGYTQSGVVELKGWSAASDARDTHLQAGSRYNEQGAIPLNQDFQVGAGSGPCPGSIGLPEEDISCRCAIFPVLGD